MSVSTNRPEGNAEPKPRTRRALAGAGLALVPLSVFVLLGALLFPRATPPDELPLPQIDRAQIDAVRTRETALAQKTEHEGLGPEARILGTELRAYHALQIRKAPRAEVAEAKVEVEKARAFTVAREGLGAVVALFAVQQERFLAELSHWERTPEADPAHETERNELGGAYVDRLREAQWIEDRHVVPNDDERRVLFKLMWGTDIGLEGEAPFALSLDERRVLYGLFLRAPHPPELLQPSLAAARARAKTQQECEQADREIRRATAKWRVAKIVALSEIDPTYPKLYALGIAQLEAEDAAAAAQAFRTILATDPDGPYALRSRNLLKHALALLEQ